MERCATEAGALGEAVVFLDYFNDMPDHRQPGKVVYPLDEVLLLSLLAVLAGADGFTDIARFGAKKIDLLRRFRPFADGAPPHDTLGDIFATLDAGAFQRCFVHWVAALTKTPAEVIAIGQNAAPQLSEEGLERADPSSPSRAIRGRCWRTWKSSSASRKPTDSRTRRSAGTEPSMATMAASKQGTIP